MAKYDDETIVLYDKMYIPATQVQEHLVDKHYTHSMYEEQACRRCPNKVNRHNYECDNCEAFKGIVQTYKFTSKKGVDYYAVPLGDRENVEKRLKIDFDDFKFVDLRVKPKFDYNVKLIGLTMRDYQDEAANAWRKKKFGMIVAPPRSGKTPLALYLSVKQGVRTMMLANQHEFLTQFIDHVERYTNLPRLQDKYGVKLYGFAKTLDDYDTLQIGVSTYQQFFDTDRGKERFARMRPNFGNLLIDEADKGAANGFAKVINGIPARYRTGFTGTDKRKDQKDKITEQIIGSVICRITIPQLKAKIIIHRCDYVKSRSAYTGKAGFTNCCKMLSNHKKRMDEIIEYVGKDLKNGHSIVIPVYFRDHVSELVKRINTEYGAKIAEGFTGGAGKKHKDLREEILQRAKDGKTRVIVGIRSILQRGLNVPRWSCLYYIQPMNNEPNWKQESSRVLTPLDGKRDPIIRMFVDPNIGLSLGCFVSTYKQALGFNHEPTDKARELAKELMRDHGAKRGSKDMDSDEAIYLDSKPRRTLKKEKTMPQGLFGSLKRLKPKK